MKARIAVIGIIALCAASVVFGQTPRRRATPVNTAATTTQSAILMIKAAQYL